VSEKECVCQRERERKSGLESGACFCSPSTVSEDVSAKNDAGREEGGGREGEGEEEGEGERCSTVSERVCVRER